MITRRGKVLQHCAYFSTTTSCLQTPKSWMSGESSLHGRYFRSHARVARRARDPFAPCLPIASVYGRHLVKAGEPTHPFTYFLFMAVRHAEPLLSISDRDYFWKQIEQCESSWRKVSFACSIAASYWVNSDRGFAGEASEASSGVGVARRALLWLCSFDD